jgi:hypothetical protein
MTWHGFTYITFLPHGLIGVRHFVLLDCLGFLDPCVACADCLVGVFDASLHSRDVVGDLTFLVARSLHADNGLIYFVQLGRHRLRHGDTLMDSMSNHRRELCCYWYGNRFKMPLDYGLRVLLVEGPGVCSIALALSLEKKCCALQVKCVRFHIVYAQWQPSSRLTFTEALNRGSDVGHEGAGVRMVGHHGLVLGVFLD